MRFVTKAKCSFPLLTAARPDNFEFTPKYVNTKDAKECFTIWNVAVQIFVYLFFFLQYQKIILSIKNVPLESKLIN